MELSSSWSYRARPEDREIRVSRLIQLWVSEGFIKPNKTQILEEIAEGYLKDLIDRNLILVHRRSRLDGKMETCQMHDLLRDLCLKTAQREKFMCMIRFDHDVPQGIDKERRFVFHERIRNESKYGGGHRLVSALLTRSLVSIECLPVDFRLLRVMDIYDDSWQWAERTKQVNLRYICIANKAMGSKNSYKILSSMSRLWNLQTLSISEYLVDRIEAPPEIWEMQQLRHVYIHNLHLPNPPSNHQVVLRNLQTLKKVWVSGLNDEVLKRIPNIRELEITYQSVHKYLPEDFGCLHKLQSLDLTCHRLPKTCTDHLLRNFTFPSSLQKLTLKNCELYWRQLTVIGALPNLEVLRLRENSVTGYEWSPVDGQFLRLKFLEIDDCCGLINWNAESSHFPVLEKLVLSYLRKLIEIPPGIGEIATLGLIDVIDCSDSAAISAMKILAEQESLGYEDCQVRIMNRDKDDLKRLKEKVVQQLVEEGFTPLTRLRIRHYDWIYKRELEL